MVDANAIRYINELGMIYIPKELRRAIGWTEGDGINIACDTRAQTLILQRAKPNHAHTLKEVFDTTQERQLLTQEEADAIKAVIQRLEEQEKKQNDR